MKQLFDDQPRVTQTDRKRLMPILSGWPKLSPNLKTLSEDDLKRCVIIESEGPKRTMILNRLLARYNKSTKTRILHAIQNP